METPTSGLLLQTLFDTRLPEIIRREKDNEDRINLYSTGDYWAAFECSAYLLCRKYPQCEIYPIYFDTLPHPIIMGSLPLNELEESMPWNKEEATISSACKFSKVEYEQWHEYYWN